jgi:RNA polymerase sigma-70 factor, ECF subfamily
MVANQASAVVRGREAVASRAMRFAGPTRIAHPALVNGAAGVVVTVDGQPVTIMAFTVVNDTIVAIKPGPTGSARRCARCPPAST